MLMSRTAQTTAIFAAIGCLTDAKILEEQAEGITPGQPADESGKDDFDQLAAGDQANRDQAAEGRVLDGLVKLRDAYPNAFLRLTSLPAAPQPAPAETPPVAPAPPSGEPMPPATESPAGG
jgi:hypothetical protein